MEVQINNADSWLRNSLSCPYKGRIGLNNLEFGVTVMASNMTHYDNERFVVTMARMKATFGRSNIKKMAEMAIAERHKALSTHT